MMMKTHIGPLVIDIADTKLNQEDIKVIQNPLVSGVILFSRNFQNKEQIKRLIENIRKIKESPVLIMVDYEGGRVQRFTEGFTRIPPMGELGELYNNDPEKAKLLAYQYGMTTAQELFEIGVDLSFSPVLDIDHGVSAIIGNRSFSQDKVIVTELAKAYINGLKKIGMHAVGKHFPGHGGVVNDTHESSAIDSRSFSVLWDNDLYPYQQLIPDYLEAIMPSHVTYPEDSAPACFSTFWLNQILRKELGFTGVVFSDDMSMKAAVNHGSTHERVRNALSAGCDWVLICNDRVAVESTLVDLEDFLQKNPLSEAQQRRQIFVERCVAAR